MPKIKLTEDCRFGQAEQILDKPKEFLIYLNTLKIGYEVVSEKAEVGKIIASNIGMEEAYGRLGEGEKDSIRKGFKKLVLRKAGWILLDC